MDKLKEMNGYLQKKMHKQNEKWQKRKKREDEMRMNLKSRLCKWNFKSNNPRNEKRNKIKDAKNTLKE